jgi:hypothetical protein
MSSAIISSIIISGITEGYTSEYIANVLWKQGLAQVNRINMVPYLDHETNTICFTAYADIQEWADTETAFNFIKRLDKTFVARIVHNDDDSWHVRITTRYNANHNVHLYAYATNFNTQYFYSPFEKGEENTLREKMEDKEEYELEDEDEDYCQEMEDILYDIEEHERLTEEEYEVLFQQFEQEEELIQYQQLEEQELELECADDWDTLANDCHTMRLAEMQHDVKSDNEWTRVVAQIYKNNAYAYAYDGIQDELDLDLDQEPDRDYIQSVLDRIDNNRISHMEQGQGQGLGLYSYF